MAQKKSYDELEGRIEELERELAQKSLLVEKLKKSDERFSFYIGKTRAWMWEIDPAGMFTFSNSAVENVIGYTPKEIIMKKYHYEFFHPKEKKKLKRLAFQIMAKRKPVNRFSSRHIHKDGKEIWLSTKSLPFFDQDGNLSGYRGSSIVISKEKQLEEKLQV